jgi:hypothetical protein
MFAYLLVLSLTSQLFLWFYAQVELEATSKTRNEYSSFAQRERNPAVQETRLIA